MTLEQATAQAVRAVLGRQLDDFRAARAAHRAGALAAEQFEPLQRDFTNTLDRRRDIIAAEIRQLLAPPAVRPCCVRTRRVDGAGATLGLVFCEHDATTLVAGKPYCDRHAGKVPRLPVPAKGGAA